MAFLRCKSCGQFQSIPTAKYKIFGVAISAFGIFGWFSYMFAGSGNALLIASVIVIAGIICFCSATELGKKAILETRCPNCAKISWDETPYDSDKQIN